MVTTASADNKPKTLGGRVDDDPLPRGQFSTERRDPKLFRVALPERDQHNFWEAEGQSGDVPIVVDDSHDRGGHSLK